MKLGVYLGRFCPPHIGHCSVINKMISETDDQLLLIGSSTTSREVRVPFNYLERRAFIKKLYPSLKVQGIPDVNGDDIWIQMLDDIVFNTFKTNEVVFYGGSEQDVSFFFDYGKDVKIIDRGIIPVNATFIRQLMMLGKDISPFVDKRIVNGVSIKFGEIIKEME